MMMMINAPFQDPVVTVFTSGQGATMQLAKKKSAMYLKAVATRPLTKSVNRKPISFATNAIVMRMDRRSFLKTKRGLNLS
jgi:hypothetical protein